MTTRLPLVAAQPGIWMAEALSTLPNAWSVAHYVELRGEVDAPLLAQAVVAGMSQADTLRMRFWQEEGESGSSRMRRLPSRCRRLSTCVVALTPTRWRCR